MATSREVSISVKVDDSGSDGAFRRLTARFNELGDVSDKSIRQVGANIERQLIVAYNKGGNREVLETTRRLAPEIRALQEMVKAGSFSMEDYSRRMKMVSSFTQQAIEQTNHLGEAFRKVDDDAESTKRTLNEMLGEFGGNLAARAVTYLTEQIKNLGQQGLNTALQVEQVVANVSTIKDIDTSKVSDDLYRLSTEIPQQAEQMGEGLYEIFSSVEASQKQALNLTELYAKGAVAARTETAVFGAAISGTLNAYKSDLSEATHYSDVFFNTVKLGVVNGRELASGLGLVTQPAKNLSIDFDTLGGMIAGITKEGGLASVNINNLANVLMKLPTKEVTEGLKQMKIETSDKGNFRPILDVLTELKGKLDEMPPALRAAKLQELFPDAQARTGLTTILSQLDFVKNATLENARAAGTTEEAYKKMSSTASSQFTMLYNSIIAFLAKLSEWVTQSRVLGGVLGWIGSLFQILANNTGKTIVVIVALTVAFGALAIAFNAVNVAAFISQLFAFTGTIRTVIATVALLGKVMVGTASLVQGAQATMVAATLGWGAVAIAVVAVVGALYQYFAASKEVKTADEERIQTLTKLVDVTNDDIKFLNDRNISLRDSAAAQTRYDSILKSVAVTNQLTIKDIGNEIDQRKELSRVLEEQNALRQEQLRSEAVIAAVASKTKLEEALVAETQLQAKMKERKVLTDQLKAGVKDYSEIASDGTAVTLSLKSVIESLDIGIGKLSETSKESRKVLDEQVAVLAQMAMHSHQTGLEFLQSNDILATNSEAQKQLGEQIQRVIDLIQKQKEEALQAGKAMRDYANDIQLVQLAKADVSITNEGVANIANQIQTALQTAKDNGKDYKETLRQLKPIFDQLATSLRSGAFSAEDYSERLKTVPEEVKKAFNESRKIGEYNPFEKSTKGAKALQKAVSDAKIEITKSDFNKSMRNLDGGMKLMIEQYAKQFRIPQQLAFAQIWSESRFKPVARSEQGAQGLTQGMPGTFSQKRFGGFTADEMKNPKNALTFWGKYMTFLFERFGDWDLAVLAYHQGEGTVDKLVAAMKQGKTGEGIIGKKGKAYREQISALSGMGGDQKFVLAETEESRLLRDIEETRTRINKLITDGGDANEMQLDGLREYENNLKQIQDIAEEINSLNLKEHLVIALPDNPAEAKKVIERLNLIKTTVTSLRSQAEGASQRLFELGDELNGSVSEVEKFDYQMKVLRESGILTAADFDLLADEIEKVRGKLILISQVEYAKKLRDDAKSVTEAFGQMSASFKYELLNFGDKKSPLNDFLKQVEGIKELQIEPGKLIALKDLFTVGQNVDVEKFAQHMRLWLEFLAEIDMFDESKIDGVIEKLKAAAEGFNAVNEATKNADYDSLRKGLEDQYDELLRCNREMTVYEETLRKLDKDYKHLDPAQQQNLLNLAAEIDAVKELNRQHAELKDFFKETLTYALEGDFKGLLRSLTDRVRDAFTDRLSDWLATNILGFDPNATDNPVAKPIVEKISKTNELLTQILNSTGGDPTTRLFNGATGGSLGGIQSRLPGIFGGLLGGDLGNRNGINSPYVLNMSGSGDGGAITNADVNNWVFDLPGGNGEQQNTTLWGSIKNLFSTEDGGIFAPRRNILTGEDSKWGGIIGGAGSLAQILGSLIGGRAGNVLSMAGTGAQIGSMFGGIGAGIGAAAGALFGLFSNPQRKQDEQARTQAKQVVLQNFDQIISQLNAHQIDPPSNAGIQADQLITEYRNAMSQLKDSKTRRIALNELAPTEAIGYKRNLINTAIQAELEWRKNEANRQKVASEFTGQFAGGIYMDSAFANQYQEFKRYNGLMPGVYDSKDYIKALIGDGEMVLNSIQQMRVIANARMGADNPFEDAGIPNYKKQPSTPKFAGGASIGLTALSSSSSNSNSSKVFNFNPDKVDVVMEYNPDLEPGEARIKSIAIDGVKQFLKGKGKK